MMPNYDVSELRLAVYTAGWVLGVSRLGSTTRLSPASTESLTIDEVSSINLTWETTIEEDLYVLPSISRMVISTPAPEAKELPVRATVALRYRDEVLWTGSLRDVTARPVKRAGRQTIWVTTLVVDGPEQALETRTATLQASEEFVGVSTLMEQPGISFTRRGSSDASARCLAVHLPPHSQMSQSKLAFVRMFAKQTGSGLMGYNHHVGGWELRHAEDAPTFTAAMAQASDGELGRAQQTGRIHIMPSRGASEEDPPDYIVFPETDPNPTGQTAGYYSAAGYEQTDVSPLTTTYTFPNHMATLPMMGKDHTVVRELLVPFNEDWFDSEILFQPLPWRGSVDFEDGEGERDVAVLAVVHEINPQGWLMRMTTTRGTILDRYPDEDVSNVGGGVPGEIADAAGSGGSGTFTITWNTTARGPNQNPKVLVGLGGGTVGALNPFWAARDPSMGGLEAWAIVNRSAGTHTFTGLAPGAYSAQVWHLGYAGRTFLSLTDTTIPGVTDGAGNRYTIGGHSRTVNDTVT